MSADHRKPVVAFVVLALAAAGLIGVQRAEAQHGRLFAAAIAAGGQAYAVNGLLPEPGPVDERVSRARVADLGPAFQGLLGGVDTVTILEAPLTAAAGSGDEGPATATERTAGQTTGKAATGKGRTVGKSGAGKGQARRRAEVSNPGTMTSRAGARDGSASAPGKARGVRRVRSAVSRPAQARGQATQARAQAAQARAQTWNQARTREKRPAQAFAPGHRARPAPAVAAAGPRPHSARSGRSGRGRGNR